MSPARQPDTPPPRRSKWRSPWRIVGIAAVAVIVLLAGAAAVFVATFDPDSLKPRIVEAVKRATGRDLALKGGLGLKVSLQPTIEARDVAFANPAGFSRPDMATIGRLQLQLGLLPLLSSRIEIDRLVLIRPDILLETNAAGQPNWQLTPQAPPAGGQPQADQPREGAGKKVGVSVAAISIQDGTLAYRDDRTDVVRTLGLPRLEAAATSPDAPLHLEADAAYNGTGLNLIADTGPLTRLQDGAATTPWPVRLTLAAAGARLSADGSITQPLLGRGYDLAANGAVPDLSALAPLLPGVRLPPLRDVAFAAKVADQGGAFPAVSALTLHVGASDLGSVVPRLLVSKLDVAGPALDQPVKAELAARFGDAPLAATATLGPLSQLMPDAKPQPFPVDVAAQAAGATVTAKGSLADARAISGANLAVAAQVPDLAALSPLARTALPPLKSIAFHATLTDMPGGFRNGVALRGLSLSNPEADLSGDAALGLLPRKSLTATLASNRIDLDALQAAVDQAAVPQPGATPAGAAPPGAPPAANPAQRRSERIFSDQPIPLDQLRAADANVRLAVGTLRSGGADYKAVNAHVALANGKLAVDQLTAALPQGQLNATLSADASQPVPPVHVSLHAAGVALKSILTLLHEPSYANGNLEAYADLNGAGASPHAIAASVDGSVGLAMAGGTIDNRLLGSVLGRVMSELNALNLVGRGGTSELRCFGLRADAQHGVATIRALALSSALLTMTGSGTVNLGEEALALTLRPEARFAGTQLVVPIRLAGPMRSPAIGVNKLGATESNVGAVAGALAGGANPLGALGGLLGTEKLAGGGDVCPSALAVARGGKAPPEGQAAPTRALEPTVTDPGAALRNLFR